MGKQNKRKSGEGVTASPNKPDVPKTPKTPKNNAATPKKVKIQAESPMQGKNKPLKTPIKHKAPKSPVSVSKKAATNGAKKSPKPKLTLLPQDLSKNLSRRQKKRIVSKIAKVMKHKGKEDLTNVDPTDATIKEILEKMNKNETTASPANKSAKAKVVKKVAAEDEAGNETKAKTPKKKPVPKKTPKKSPQTN